MLGGTLIILTAGTKKNERNLFEILNQSPCKFILSTWHSNQHRKNIFLETLWSEFHVLTKEHFYHVGGKEENRKPMLEALVVNFRPKRLHEKPIEQVEQLLLLEKLEAYRKNEGLVL